jgi:hypothetical protein
MPPVVRPLPPPPNRKVAAPGRETASIARSPAPDREVTDRDGRSSQASPGAVFSRRDPSRPRGRSFWNSGAMQCSMSGRVTLSG